MSILKDVLSTQLEPHPAVNRQPILCVYPLRAGGAVSTTKASRKHVNENKREHTRHTFFFYPLTAGINYLQTALPFLSAAKEGFLGTDIQVVLKKGCK